MIAQDINIFFDSQFGIKGIGDGQFDYTAGIKIINAQIYVVDKQNHRIQIFDLSGSFISG